tara:strand:+ start:296 stop:574 length:279 start_codon:yes stop_codon:yes gene_type:complete
MYKKAQGISLNVIIIAAIGLVVLVLLVAIFTGRINVFGTGVEKTTEAGIRNVCLSENKVCTDEQPDGYVETSVPAGGWVDCKSPKVCYEEQG